MTSELQQFARQLATWTELIIENGRTPFRRVDLYPPIHTAEGILHPPLIFWINRQSMMAGGILLLPGRDLESELDRGRRCAEALGLRHFVTWETDKVRIWELHGEHLRVQQQFDLQQTENPDAFRQLLGRLLEALKLLSVLGMVPPAELSPDYLHNLFQTTLDLALPPLVSSFRSQRARDDSNVAADADLAAEEAGRLLLLQLLTLLWHRQLPGSILPEKLERAIELTLPNLPDHLRVPLARKVFADQPALPYDSAVSFHHLLLRLRQISWQQPPERALRALERLIDYWYPGDSLCDRGQVCLYPHSPKIGPQTEYLLSASPVLLATAALLDDLQQQPPRQQFFGTTFTLELPAANDAQVVGHLNETRLPTREERQNYETRLRTSWPNRRFRLGSDAPLWQWETLHLLGLCRHGSRLALSLPPGSLETPANGPFWPLLGESFQLEKLTLEETGQVCLQLHSSAEPHTASEIVSSTGNYSLSLARSPEIRRSQVLLALALPAEIYPLLEHDLPWPDRAAADSPPHPGLSSYTRTRLARFIWQRLSKDPLPAVQNLPRIAAELGYPLPTVEILDELVAAGKPPAREDSDQLLAELLACPAVASLDLPETRQPSQPPTRAQLSDKELRNELLQQLQDEGLPIFPDKYLYFLDNPEMVRYQFSPPLQLASEFLGQIELKDSCGQILQVYGAEHAQALLLCSELERTSIELPADREQLALLLESYRQDLKLLQQHLSSLCFSRLQSAKAARKLANKIWKKLEVPNQKWLKD